MNASRERVYRALIDADAIAIWKVPTGMSSRVHAFEGGTEVLAVHEGLPRAVPRADNEAGWREALAKLAALVETA